MSGESNTNKEVYSLSRDKFKSPNSSEEEFNPEKQSILELAQEIEDTIEPVISETITEINSHIIDIEKECDKLTEHSDAINTTEIKKFAEIKKTASGVIRSLRDAVKIVTPLLIPLIFAAKFSRTEIDPSLSSFSNREKAQIQLDNTGITSERKTAYVMGVSDLLYKGITPIGYQKLSDIITSFPVRLATNRERAVTLYKNKDGEDRNLLSRKTQTPEREDAWRLYLGLPQEKKTFGISEYQPVNSDTDKYYYKINNWFEKFSMSLSTAAGVGYNPMRDIVTTLDELSNEEKVDTPWVAYYGSDFVISTDARVSFENLENYMHPFLPGVMGDFKLSKGQDEKGNYISYYDFWDLGGSGAEDENGLLGKPFEIYDRVYYDPITYEVLH